MNEQLSHLRLAAVNIDGVMLNDTFSPVIHHFVTSRGGTYSAALERRIFSRPQDVAGQRMAEAVDGNMSGPEALCAYFEDRAEYVRDHPVQIMPGAVELVARLRGLGLQTICYGGLGKEHFDRFLGEHTGLFDDPHYVCTNTFRPGIREISTDIFGLRPDQVLFIDDVATVGEAAAELGVAFIGHPSRFEHSHQRALMAEAGVGHIVDSLDALDADLLHAVDATAAAGTRVRRDTTVTTGFPAFSSRPR
ncbi:HAD family hydrolase [Streptomyces sp. NPDC005244]|uniref:HAD family hydrolase n=1 Tax=Streptomyces sp. NPDC005244 TaxID=3364708 RepID=UPI0036BEA216